MFSLDRVWNKFGQNFGKFGFSIAKIGFCLDKCSNKNLNNIVTLQKLINLEDLI